MPPQSNPSNGLPAGYSLDSRSAAGSSAGLPTGYTLDAGAPTPNPVGAPGLASPSGAPPKLGTLPNGGDTGEGPIAAGLTSMETQFSKMPAGPRLSNS